MRSFSRLKKGFHSRGDRECAPVSREGRWQKPERGLMKVNWDVAFKGEICKMGARIVIRNSDGDSIATLGRPQLYVNK